MMIPEIQRDELAELIRGNQLILVEALPEQVYAEGHLHGAVNIRPCRVDELAPALLPDPNTRIVVYCGSASCDASLRVAQRLHHLGYHNVHRHPLATARADDPFLVGLGRARCYPGHRPWARRGNE